MEYKTDKLRPTQPFLVLETQDFKQEIYLNQGISHFYTFRLEKTKEITTVPDSCVDMLFEYGENGMNAYAIGSPIKALDVEWQVKKAYNSHEDKIKFTYMEQKEYETIDDDIEKLENRVSELDDEIAKNATSYSKLAELTKEKEDVERQLEEKMERWEYLNDLAEKIEKQKQ